MRTRVRKSRPSDGYEACCLRGVGSPLSSSILAGFLAFAVGCTGSASGGDPGTSVLESDGAVGADGAQIGDGGVAPDPDPDPDAGAGALPPPPEPPPDCPRVRTTTVGLSLNVRSEPSTDGAIVATLAEGSMVEVLGIVEGDAVEGITTWYEVDAGGTSGYVSGRWAECTTDAPPPPPPAPPPDDGFYLPLRCGMSARISQGNNSGFSHSGYSAYAFDFSIPLDTPLHAMRRGRVIKVYDRTRPGDPCYSGGGRDCITKANLVWIRHADGTVTSYAHLNRATVAVGDRVERGDVIGRSGSSGYSTGPHAHVARQEDCGGAGCQSIRMRFQDVPGDGIPETGDRVTSGNCP